MSKQETDFSRRKMLGQTVCFMLRRSVLAGIIAVLLMGASFIFMRRASAHNIDLAKVKVLARDYARKVREESGGKYIRSTWNCVNAFPKHNHIVRCLIEHQNASDKAAGVYTCKESIEIFMLPHGGSAQEIFALYGRHTSYNQCGRIRLNSTLLTE